MKRFPMMLQLTLIMFFVMAIPISILTWYSETQILQYSENAIAGSTLDGLNANRKLNENALNNLSQNVVRLATTRILDRIRDFKTLDEINANYNNLNEALVILKELMNLNNRVEGVYSSYFYLKDSDYVVSTDKGITMLEKYEAMDWMDEVFSKSSGVSGVWQARTLSSGRNVLSYVLPLSHLSTTTQGTIVVNLLESQVRDYLHNSKSGKHSYLMLESDGTILSHSDENLFLTDGEQLPFIEDILQRGIQEGYSIHQIDGERLIYAWHQSSLSKWWNINIYSMDELMGKAHSLQNRIFILTGIFILLGAFLTVFLATWLSKPLRQLAQAVRSRSNGYGFSNKNELVFLDAAFKRMQEEEEGLYKLIKESEQDARNLATYNLLRGEVSKQIEDMFLLPAFRIAVVSIDRYRKYVNHTNPETRNYHRLVLIAKCEGLFPENFHSRSVYHGDGNFVIVFNYNREDMNKDFDEFKQSFIAIREAAVELLGHTVTIGISSQSDEYSTVPEQLVEAMEVIKHRMIEGTGGITFWKEESDQSDKYIYPANSERRILNYLDSGDLESIIKELELIRNEIHSAVYISYYNILFIYNQLVGVTIKHLREKNINTARIFSGSGNLYSTIASIDTLDELEEYFHEFFKEIIQYQVRNSGENYGERIIQYLEEHFTEEIMFEEMAKEIGISYSYMRKITFELTGKSLSDYMNMLRIEKAKQMLLETNMNVAQISSEVGYYNVQSFYRFFRKYEGMPPSSFKALKQESTE